VVVSRGRCCWLDGNCNVSCRFDFSGAECVVWSKVMVVDGIIFVIKLGVGVGVGVDVCTLC